MSRIVRLTEADLVRLVKKIVKEEDAFTFGDKLKNTKLGNLVGFHKTTESERELAEKIYQSMVDGNFEFIGKLYSRKPSYRVIVYMRDGDYEVEARTDTNLEGGSSTYTAVKLPNGKMKHIFRKGFTDKLKELIEKSQGFDEDKRID